MDISDESDRTLTRTIQLAAVPAPTNHEANRAAMVETWWREDGLRPTRDSAGNVLAQIRSGIEGAIVVCAHLDTVFGVETEHDPRVEDDLLLGPGVGDDTVGVAALSALDRILPESLRHSVWLLATVGEEGAGNLVGIRSFLDDPPEEVLAVIALEGNYLGRVVHTGIGVVRFSVSLEGQGGHSWEAAESASAVQEMAKMICSLEQIEPETPGRWSLNIGEVRGGEGINVRAKYAEFSFEFRAEDPSILAQIESRAMALIGAPSPMQIGVSEIGRRPAGSIPRDHPLVVSGVEGLTAIGWTTQHPAASTDANASYEKGIPAISVGITEGGGEHTPDEWIRIDKIGDGLIALATTITAYSRIDK